MDDTDKEDRKTTATTWVINNDPRFSLGQRRRVLLERKMKERQGSATTIDLAFDCPDPDRAHSPIKWLGVWVGLDC